MERVPTAYPRLRHKNSLHKIENNHPNLTTTAAFSFVAGFLVMGLEMSWLRLLEWQLGSTVQAAAMAVASFFFFAALGSLWRGTHIHTTKPHRQWGIAILLAALVSWAAFQTAAGPVGSALSSLGPLARCLFFPLAGAGSFFLGTSFPALAAWVVHSVGQRTGRGGFIYAAELAGGLSGVLLGGVFLPLAVGHAQSITILCTVAVAAGSAALLKGFTAKMAANPIIPNHRPQSPSPAKHTESTSPNSPGAPHQQNTPPSPPHPQPARLIPTPNLWLPMLSGFLTTAWQIAAVEAALFEGGFSLWMTTGVFAGALAGLSAGAALAAFSAAKGRPFPLWQALLTSAISMALFPWLLAQLLPALLKFGIEGLIPVWGAHLLGAALPALLGGILPGMVFPLSWNTPPSPQVTRQNRRHHNPDEDTPEASGALGLFAGWNKLAAAAGAIACAWCLLPLWGAGGLFLALSLLYLLTALLLTPDRAILRAAAISSLFLCLLASAPFWQWLNKSGFTLLSHPLEPLWDGTLLETRASPYGRISVVESPSGSRRIFVGRRYALNGTNEALHHQRNQALIPWALASNPHSILHIGAASGITSGTFLQNSTLELHAVEIIPEIAELARRHFSPWNNRVFDDPRTTLLLKDGRNVVRHSHRHYDLIVADMFHPTRPSTRLLYTREFFAQVKSRLSPHGLFCLWLPVFQMDEPMFDAIAHNFAREFPGAFAIRANFSPRQPVIGIVGFKQQPESLPALFQNASRKTPAPSHNHSLFFLTPCNFLLAFIAPLEPLLKEQPPHPISWQQPWFTLRAAEVRDGKNRLHGRALLRKLDNALARWQPINDEAILHRASAAALRYTDSLLPWIFPTANDTELEAKIQHTREQKQKAMSLYPGAVWMPELD